MAVPGAEKKSGWWQLREAARVLNGGGVVAHATEGVWGLACNPLDPGAVAKVLTLKSRDPDQGLILLGHRSNVFAQELADRCKVLEYFLCAWMLVNRDGFACRF